MPFYSAFVSDELSADKSLEGSKVQFAQVYPSFMEHAFKVSEGQEEHKQRD